MVVSSFEGTPRAGFGDDMTPGNDQYVRNVPTMKTGMTRLLLWVQIGISLSCTTVAQASFDDMVSRKGWIFFLRYSFFTNSEQLQNNQRNRDEHIFKKMVKMAASDA